eukprot:TRINITY_DN3891_c1_g3_i2.p1 TRINITY_DN3891_c1_g3~~TRINITY_DN3891_c1_g3_i2.p1  ORF type:complete len:144 (+),score=78.13 TRINITY_DN3891_c1_g3_i2:69-500(+)
MMMKLLFATLCALLVCASAVERKGTNQHLWADSEQTTTLWRLISSNSKDELKTLLDDKPQALFTRSGDGRGPLWWAYEYGQDDIVKLLVEAGANEDEEDADGKKPKDVRTIGRTEYEKKRQEEVEAELNAADEGDYDEEDYDY